MESVGDRALPSAHEVDEDAWLSPSRAASEVGVSRQTIYDWIRRRHIVADGSAGAMRVRRGDVRRLASVRRAIVATGFRSTTVRRWADGTAPGDPPTRGENEPTTTRAAAELTE